MRLSIALCTYNGEPYLREQLKSIAAQTLPPDELVVCDDCSCDRTPEILKEFSESVSFPVHIHLNEENLGPLGNFSKAVGLCQGNWVALCDQDDIWLPDKLERLVRKMEQLETTHGNETPLLIHADAVVADSELRTIAGSLWKFQYTKPEKGHSLSRLLSQNVVTGCTALFNRPLWLKARPVPNEAMMHDWWLALVASVFGTIGHVPGPTIHYRQHGLNDTGAKTWGLSTALRLFFDLQKKADTIQTRNEIAARTRNQAQAFLDRYHGGLSNRHKETLNTFIDLPQRSYFVRKFLIVRYDLHYHGLMRNLGNLILK